MEDTTKLKLSFSCFHGLKARSLKRKAVGINDVHERACYHLDDAKLDFTCPF